MNFRTLNYIENNVRRSIALRNWKEVKAYHPLNKRHCSGTKMCHAGTWAGGGWNGGASGRHLRRYKSCPCVLVFHSSTWFWSRFVICAHSAAPCRDSKTTFVSFCSCCRCGWRWRWSRPRRVPSVDAGTSSAAPTGGKLRSRHRKYITTVFFRLFCVLNFPEIIWFHDSCFLSELNEKSLMYNTFFIGYYFFQILTENIKIPNYCNEWWLQTSLLYK